MLKEVHQIQHPAHEVCFLSKYLIMHPHKSQVKASFSTRTLQ